MWYFLPRLNRVRTNRINRFTYTEKIFIQNKSLNIVIYPLYVVYRVIHPYHVYKVLCKKCKSRDNNVFAKTYIFREPSLLLGSRRKVIILSHETLQNTQKKSVYSYIARTLFSPVIMVHSAKGKNKSPGKVVEIISRALYPRVFHITYTVRTAASGFF